MNIALPRKKSRLFSAIAATCLCVIFLAACGNPKKPAPVAPEIINTLIGQLAQGDLIQIATHYRDKQSVNAFMQDSMAHFAMMGTYNESEEIVEDYMSADNADLAGFSIGYDSKTGRFKNIVVGLQPRLSAVAEPLIGKALHTSYQKKDEADKLASKQSYYLGYMRLDEERRLDITLEQTTTRDKRNLYSFLYDVEPMLKEKQNP